MADAQLKLSRRALLGAACAAPVLSRHPGLDPGSTFSPSVSPDVQQGRWTPDQVRHGGYAKSFAVTNWDRALRRFHAADSALAALAHIDDDHLYDRALGRWNAALKRLLRAPAPAPAALALKLDLLVDHEFWEITGTDRCLAAMRDDARRFAASAAG